MARLNRAQVVEEAKRLARAHDIDLADTYDPESGERIPGLRRLNRQYRGRFDLPWMPQQVADEYAILVRRARSNWLKLVVAVQAQRLKVDGFRSSIDAPADDVAFARWQYNGMDAGQNKVHRGALALSRAYVSVWPDVVQPRIAGDSALTMYGEPEPSDPRRVGLALKRWQTPNGTMAALYDDDYSWPLRRDRDAGWVILGDPQPHRLGRCPVVAFLNDADLEGGSFSEIEPLLPIQERINETLLDRLMAQKFGAFKQKWATGIEVDDDENGNPIEPFKAGIDRILLNEKENGKFGEFDATELAGYIAAVEDDVRQMASLAQVPPQALLGAMANLSGEALDAAESGLKFKIGDKQADFGEAWEDVMRLAALAAGDDSGASDTASQVIWRDTEARSRTQIADSIQKLSTIPGMPMEFLLEEYGLSQGTIKRVMQMIPDQAPADSPDLASEFKSKADALGVLIRAGVDPVEAANQVGLPGLDFTGAVPVSLRVPAGIAAGLEG
jgi:hypothetical protein